MKKALKIIGKIMLYAAGVFVLIIAGLFLFLAYHSPGQPKPFVDADGKKMKNSISEKIVVEINGVQQGMFIKGENIDNPMILVLHGGMPFYFITEKYPTGLEQSFTLVWWEQRGCGISGTSGSASSQATVELLIDDTIVVTKYLLERFQKQKLYLMAHSGGTFLGVQVIDKNPEYYHAYIAISQMSDQWTSEKMAFNFMREKYIELNNQKMADRFNKIEFERNGELSRAYLKLRDVAMHDLGIGTMRTMNNLATDLFWPSLMFSEYTLAEKYQLWANKVRSGISQSWETIASTNLMETNNTFEIPIYFLHGQYDYTCSYELTRQYFDRIQAPIKGFYTFEHSAHSPIFEEPARMKHILLNDVVNASTELADKISPSLDLNLN